MELDLAVLATTFLVIVPAELPDKTFVATLILATKFRPMPVWLGVSAAFAIQCLVAVAFGGVLTLLPHRLVLVIAAVLFGAGAVLMFHSAARANQDMAEEEAEIEEVMLANPRRAFVTSFLVLFAAEWGDLSQVVTAGLVARTHQPLSVFLGSFAALILVAGAAVVAGHQLAQRLPLVLIRRIAGTLFATLALVTVWAAVRS